MAHHTGRAAQRTQRWSLEEICALKLLVVSAEDRDGQRTTNSLIDPRNLKKVVSQTRWPKSSSRYAETNRCCPAANPPRAPMQGSSRLRRNSSCTSQGAERSKIGIVSSRGAPEHARHCLSGLPRSLPNRPACGGGKRHRSE